MHYPFRLMLLCSLFLMALKPASVCSAQTGQASILLERTGKLWKYTVLNMEQAESSVWITSLFLPITVSVSDIQSPKGWTISTDFSSFILWSNSEPHPYSNDIPPGGSLSGFNFLSAGIEQAGNYALGRWNHENDEPGLDLAGTVSVPTLTYGDINSDGKVDAVDLTLALRIFLEGRAPSWTELQAGDVRPKASDGRRVGDGAIMADDLNWIFRRFIGLTSDPFLQ